MSSESDPMQRWQVAGEAPLRWRCWAGDYVVFHPLSGQTHFLEILAGRLLRLIMAGTASTAELRLEAARFLEVDPDNRLARAVDDLVRRLEGVGLIEPAP